MLVVVYFQRFMRKLTHKEEEIMKLFWEKGGLFVKDILEIFPEPKPHFNTVSTQVRILEKDGFLGHKQYGGSFQYLPVVTEEQYRRQSLTGLIKNWFDNSYKSAVSTLLKDEKLTVEDLKELIAEVENAKNSK